MRKGRGGNQSGGRGESPDRPKQGRAGQSVGGGRRMGESSLVPEDPEVKINFEVGRIG